MKKILVAMSGGVDSSVSALILKNQGYEVNAAYIKTWINEEINNDLITNCPWQQDINDAKKICDQLNINFEIINLIEEYNNKVVEYMIQGYQSGNTPNPDIFCNYEIKFGNFLNYALSKKYDAIATGHYCRKILNDNGSYDLYEGIDKKKDQSYFLSLINQFQLSKILFPIGDLYKYQVRDIAKKYKLHTALKKDSQGICFLGKVKINKFLNKFIKDKEGIIENNKGEIIGKHKGLHYFTLGQRKGINIPSNTYNKNYVVIKKDEINNKLIVDFENENNNFLYKKEVYIEDISFINNKINNKCKIQGKPRYQFPRQNIIYNPINNKKANIIFETKQRALSKGQLLALYDKEKLLGGGFYI